MNVIDLEILIPASPEFIWRFMGDLAALPQWQENVSSVSFLSTQREGQGTRWRASADNNSDTVVEISAWYDTLGYEYSVKDGTSFGENQGRIRLHEVTDGTLVRWTFQYELKGVFGGLRNAMRIKRGTTNQIQASLRNLHQLILQESGGITTHEAKASVQEAPDVSERSAYKPRHPSAFHDLALEELAASETDTDRQPAYYEFETEAETLPAVVDTDTKPNPVVLSPGFGLEIQPEPEVAPDDTKPVALEALFSETSLPPPQPAEERELVEAALPERPPLQPRETRDTAELSVFEIFGLQRPSEARKSSSTPKELVRERYQAPEPSPRILQREENHYVEPAHLAPSGAVSTSNPITIMGLRRRARRRRTMIRSHT